MSLRVFLGGIKEYRAGRIKDPIDGTPEQKLDQLQDVESVREMKGDFILDARASYTFGKNDEAKIAFIVKNVLNHEYALRPGILEAPRTYTIRFDVTF